MAVGEVGRRRLPRFASFHGRAGLLLLAALASPALGLAPGCADASTRPREIGYLRHMAFEMPGREWVALRWPRGRMPLRVHLPPPPDGLFEQPEAILDSVRDGILGWTDAAEPGLPRFVFVDDPGEADIPIVWAEKPQMGTYVAFCSYDVDVFARRFGVSHILVTAHWGEGRVADLYDIYAVMLHEMGHALGMGGHSPDPRDVMYERVTRMATEGPSVRDRVTLRALYATPIGARMVGARGNRLR